jgi:hypothetical protein
MGIKTILVESHDEKLREWGEYIKEYDRETSLTGALDLTGLGTPLEARTETLEEVLDLLGQPPAGPGPKVALIYAHANPFGLLMNITKGATADAYSAQSQYLRGISRAWRATGEIGKLRSADWSNPSKPVFLIDVPKAVALFRDLLGELKKVGAGYATRLPDPATVSNRDQADAWFDQWMGLMANACLGDKLGEDDLRRVCRAMQKVRDAKYDRVEIRACNLGKVKDNLDALKEFLGVTQVVAPKVTMFFGKVHVHSDQPAFDVLTRHLGGFRGYQFTPPDLKGFSLNQQMKDKKGRPIHIEPEMRSGRRNRIFSTSAGDVIFQQTETASFKFSGRMWAPSDAALTRFFDANYKAGYVFTSGRTSQPVGGMWCPHDASTPVPFVLPREPDYRKLLETSS